MKNSKSLLKTTAAAIGVLHVINKIIDSNTSNNTTTSSNGSYYNWKHGNIFYKKTGHGEPLLLVHDLNVYGSHHEWTKLVNHLSHFYTIYTLDLIGCGKSDKPSVTYTNYFYVQLIQNFVNDVIGEKTKVIASGLSSSFVLMSNLIDKNLFEEIMLITPPSVDVLKKTPTDHSKVLLKLFDLPVVGKSAYYIATNKANTEWTLNKKLFKNHSSSKSGLCKAYYDASHSANGNGKYLLASIEGNYLHIDITKALKNTDKRIVIVNGLHDESRKSIYASYQKINPNIVFKTISAAKKLPQSENPAELAELVHHF